MRSTGGDVRTTRTAGVRSAHGTLIAGMRIGANPAGHLVEKESPPTDRPAPDRGRMTSVAQNTDSYFSYIATPTADRNGPTMAGGIRRRVGFRETCLLRPERAGRFPCD
jgi:hypothetical protein